MNKFALSTHYTPAADGKIGSFELHLTNGGGQPVAGFSLGISGPGRIAGGAVLTGGTIIDQVGTWCEIAAPKGFVLQPGAVWTVTAARLDYPLRHWTDGSGGAMVKLADGTVHSIPVARATTVDAGPNRAEIIDISQAGDTAAAVSVIPWPVNLQVAGQHSAPEGFAIRGHSAATQAFADLVAHLFPGEALVRSAAEGGYPVALSQQQGHADEAYSIQIAKGAASITATTDTGLLYGLITLAQMARGAKRDPQRFAFPATATITDAPAYGWRGCHWDVARRFYASGEVAQFLRIMAWNKLNRFHWHLSEDEAWRIEIDAYPELTDAGAWRGYGMALHRFWAVGRNGQAVIIPRRRCAG